MNWLNINLATLRAPEYIGADPVARATWLNVTAFCCDQENGGRIAGARAWKCRQWQQTCGVTLAEVDAGAPLIAWDGDDLLAWRYPSEKEDEVRVKREAGRAGGKAKSEAKAKQSRINGQSRSQAEAKQKPSTGPTEGKGMEGEWKENGKEPPPILSAPPTAGVREGKDSAMIPTTEQSRRFAAIMHRQPTTAWAANEVAAYKRIGTVPEGDLSALERYYGANWPPRSDVNVLRHTLLTLLNNLPGEIGRAHAAAQQASPPTRRIPTAAEAYGS